jgi:kynurenine formamidase
VLETALDGHAGYMDEAARHRSDDNIGCDMRAIVRMANEEVEGMHEGDGEGLDFEPLLERDGLRVSKSPWGDDDQIGRLNWMTPESQAAVLGRADGSRMFDLAVDYFPGMPCWTEAGDPKYEIWMTHTPSGTVRDSATGAGPEVHEKYSYAGAAVSMYSHTGTHVCGLNHIGHHGTFWNGWTEERNLESRSWNVGGQFPPIIARAVLLDIAALHGTDCLPPSYAITASDVGGAGARQGVEPGRGDVVLLRTGRMRHWPDPEGFLAEPPGLGMEAARHLCEEVGVMCLGLDVGGEALPPKDPDTFLPVHAYLFATAGTPLVENLWLEDVAREQVWESAFVALPLKLRGSTGAPVRPLAIALRHGA